ncbi:SET domain-containing protein [Candidatus Bathyarchaeota archaeon]|nr:MAG: SET domain-containing protein [Candidatus Bathyarchaeota archaeon]
MAAPYRDRSWLDPRLALRKSLIRGKGLVATQSIGVDEVVVVFGGTLFSKEDIAAGKANNRTLMQVDEDLWLGDPANQPLGEDYFLNHSCDPNLWITGDVTLTARKNQHCRRIITGRDWMRKDQQARYRGHFTPFLNMRITRLEGSD